MANCPISPAESLDQAINLTIDNANRFNDILNGDITTFVPTCEGGGQVPSVSKALAEAAAYRVPLAWVPTGTEADLLQPRIYNNNVYVPLTVPAYMDAAPSSVLWRLYKSGDAYDTVYGVSNVGDTLDEIAPLAQASLQTVATLAELPDAASFSGEVRYVDGVGHFESDGTTWNPVDIPKTPETFGGVDSTAFQAAIDYATASGGALAGKTVNTDFNAAFTFRGRDVITLKAGDYTADQVLAWATDAKIVIRGAGMGQTRILLEDDKYFLSDSDNPTIVDIEGVNFVGGAGAFKGTGNAVFTRGYYRFNYCAFQGFTEAAIADLSDDWGRWDIQRNFFWGKGLGGAVQGIGAALKGWADNSIIEGNYFHKAKYGLKLGRGSAVFWVRNNSFLRFPGMVSGDQTDIWIVPDTAAPYIGGLHIMENRFGNEFLSIDDYRILIADEDAGSGADFASQSHSTAVSTRRLEGLIVERNHCSGASNKPLVYSNTPNLRGCTFANELRGNMKGEVEINPSATLEDLSRYQMTNIIDTRYSGQEEFFKYNSLGNFAPLFHVIDTMSRYGGSLATPQNYQGGADPNFVELLSPRAAIGGSSATSSTAAVTDSLGGSKAYEAIFTADDAAFAYTARVFWNVTVAAGDENKLHWLEVELKRSTTNPLDFVGVSMRRGSIAKLARTVQVPEGTSDWAMVRIPWIPAIAGSHTFTVHPSGWVTGSKTSVIIGRPRVYKASQPQNYGHVKTTDFAWDGQRLVLGVYQIWPDASGFLRGKIGTPTSITDGVVLTANAMV